jgi:hypothetical protein
MSLFNYNTRIDPIGSLQARVAKIEKLLKALKFWEVNDTAMGDKTLRRRKVTPSLTIGAVGRGPWFDIVGLNRISIGSGGTGTSASYSDYEFGFTTPTTATVTVNAGELQDSALAVKTVASAAIEVTGLTTFFIYVQYIFGGTPVILGSTTRPTIDATTIRIILHTWTLVGGVATLSKIGHLGNIYIPGTFATQT